MLFDEERDSPMPVDMEQATTEIIALRRMLRNERNMLVKVVEAREKYRRELGLVAKRSAEKDKEIEGLRAEMADLQYSVVSQTNW
jgi:hypothetical protein